MNHRIVLVTGGAGYIGSHTCKALYEKGFHLVVYDNLIYGHRDFVKWGILEEGDIADQSRIESVIKKYNPAAVIHFAAFAYVGESIDKPLKYYKNNVTGTLTLLDAMRKHGVSKIVFSSSCATYGMPQEIPITENHPQNPISPYGRTKLMVEEILKDFDKAYSTKYINLRYFNAAGADPNTEIGEWHEPETHLIPLLLTDAIGKYGGTKIYGTDYDTPDGTCIRDYIHVTDLADAHVLALEYLFNSSKSRAFNLGNGKGFSVRDIVETIKKVTRKNIKTIDWKRRDGDPPILIGSSENAIRELKWTPKYNDIDTIIETAWKWQLKMIKK